MKVYALDTNIVSYLLKGDTAILAKIAKEKDDGNTFVVPPVVYYEINNWLLKNNSKSRAAVFRKIYSVNGIGEITKEVLDIASSIYDKLRRGGITIETSDILIAAWCVKNGFILVSNNLKHFKNIKELQVENWLE